MDSGSGHALAATRLRERRQRIVESWEQRAREKLMAAQDESEPALIDELPEVLEEMATALTTEPLERAFEEELVAARHGRQRAEQPPYSLEEVIAEYQLLHDVIVTVLDDGGPIDRESRDVIAGLILVAIRASAAEFARLRLATVDAELAATDIRFRHMVEAVRDYAIFTLDPQGFITSWNAGCARMKQYTTEEAVGRHFSMLYAAEGRRRDEPVGHLRSAAIEGRYRGEGVRRRKDDEEFLADVSITAIYDAGVLTGFTEVVQDLTERNALMQERDLSRMDTMQLRADAQAREQFVVALTHDLRSPLSTATMAADLIAMHPADGERVKGWAARILVSLKRGERMIGDLLDATRVQAGESIALAFEPCDLRILAEEIRDDFASRHGDHVRIEADGALEGVWSADGLRRILDNLVGNAVKYGEPERPITIRIRRVDDRALLSIHNWGTIAVPQERLFEPFQRASGAETRGKQGWGIGLALVKGIAEAHGGIVKAESYPKEGTTFTVDLPIDARRAHAGG